MFYILRCLFFEGQLNILQIEGLSSNFFYDLELKRSD